MYVLKKADIGGVDINKDITTPKADTPAQAQTQVVEKDENLQKWKIRHLRINLQIR
ncbi:Uncharacterised protein [Actinobacillus equuli]|nr:Uncharacterised protein [Actinobacillus equuli]